VDEDALNYARQAGYTEPETRGLPQSYRERYFELVNGPYIFTADLRRSVIFGRHDLTSDAPISRIDMRLCRNTLRYLNAETQNRVVGRLGFALRRDGVPATLVGRRAQPGGSTKPELGFARHEARPGRPPMLAVRTDARRGIGSS
jgi:chemotaxis methyl-accepting protein methylase